MDCYTHIVVTTGSGIMLYSAGPSGKVLTTSLNRPIGLINNMIHERYVEFHGAAEQLAIEEGSSMTDLVQTYTQGDDVVKYVDAHSRGSVLVCICLLRLTVTPGQIRQVEELLRLISKVFCNVVLDDKLEKIDFVKAKKRVIEKQFSQYIQRLEEKVVGEFENLVEEEEEEEKEEEDEITTRQSLSSNKITNSKKSGKKQQTRRKWGADGSLIEDIDPSEFSSVAYNGDDDEEENEDSLSNLVSKDYGHKTKDGFIINDLSQTIDDILTEKKQQSNSKGFSIFQYIGIGKEITEKDLEKPCKLIKDTLVRKNVSAPIAEQLVTSLKPRLVGKKLANFGSVEKEVKSALSIELTKILTPNTSVDLLNEIYKKKATKKNEPYVISVVGVNGVGKSTNLSKLAYWLLNNKFNVLIAACDTFRSGAVEQLQVHERNLNKLIKNLKLESKLKVYEQGYGDVARVAKIARNSIEYAKKEGYDIILMDTAGRRHNDQKLMAPLKDFAIAAAPDKIIMVGEALVGTDSVMQANNFNKSFEGANRGLDFFIISKCDTVGDLIGTMVNMVYSTGIPILFVGVGQTYTDLRTLSVDWAVDTLLG